MGQLVAGTVTAGTLVKPTAAVPLNASLAANLPNSLGGRIYEQLTTGLAANIDGIYASYTVPAGSVTVQGRRLKIVGLMLSGYVVLRDEKEQRSDERHGQEIKATPTQTVQGGAWRELQLSRIACAKRGGQHQF